jgi:hypothetical protein
LITKDKVLHVDRQQFDEAIRFGEYPQEYRNLIKKFLSSKLSDPESTAYRFGTPYKGSILLDENLESPAYGYVVVVKVSERNESGRYGEERPYIFLIKDHSMWLVDSSRVKGIFTR